MNIQIRILGSHCNVAVDGHVKRDLWRPQVIDSIARWTLGLELPGWGWPFGDIGHADIEISTSDRAFRDRCCWNVRIGDLYGPELSWDEMLGSVAARLVDGPLPLWMRSYESICDQYRHFRGEPVAALPSPRA